MTDVTEPNNKQLASIQSRRPRNKTPAAPQPETLPAPPIAYRAISAASLLMADMQARVAECDRHLMAIDNEELAIADAYARDLKQMEDRHEFERQTLYVNRENALSPLRATKNDMIKARKIAMAAVDIVDTPATAEAD